MKPRGGTRDVLFFRDGHEVSQVSEFHDGVSIATKHDEQSDKAFPQSLTVRQSWWRSRVNHRKPKPKELNRMSKPTFSPQNATLLLIDHQVGTMG